MAFVCVLDPRRTFSDIARIGSSHLVTIVVGYDDEADRSFSTRIALDSMAGGDWELTFWLAEMSGDTADPIDHFSSLHVSRLIGRSDRALVRAHLLDAIRDLLNTVQPGRVFMCTFEVDLPEPALEKYRAIESVFTVCGYEIDRRPDHHGQKIWWMERVAAITIGAP